MNTLGKERGPGWRQRACTSCANRRRRCRSLSEHGASIRSYVDSAMPTNSEFYRQAVEAVVAGLGADAQRGLSEAEAQQRLGRYGPNQLATEKPVPAWRKVVAQFEDALVILLLVATAVSATMWVLE